ncbi:MAG TPA: DUF2589 domain-containing protein [Polyangium sp.]|nr:DUF2589 domain-containing protein [Polyangium sp.]
MDKRESLTQELDLKQIIGAPIRATVDADAYAAHSYIKILREYAFTNPQSDDPDEFGELRMISFHYQAPNERGQMQSHTIRVPLLSLIPLPILEITEARYQFNVRISSHGYEEPEGTSLEQKKSWASKKKDDQLRLRGVFVGKRAKRETTNMSAHIEATIQVRRADMPAGVGKLLNLLQTGILRESTPYKLIAPRSLNLSAAPSTVTIVARRGEQLLEGETILAISDDESEVSISPASGKTNVRGEVVFTVEKVNPSAGKTIMRFLWYGHAEATAEITIETK